MARGSAVRVGGRPALRGARAKSNPETHLPPDGYTGGMPVPTHRGLTRILVLVLIATVSARAEILREHLTAR